MARLMNPGLVLPDQLIPIGARMGYIDQFNSGVFNESSGGAGTGGNTTSTLSPNFSPQFALNSGTSTTGRCSRLANPAALDMFSFSSTSGRFGHKVLGMMLPVLSTGTDTYLTRTGFLDSLAGTPTDGAWFEFDTNTSVFVRARTSSNDVSTTTVTSLQPVAGTQYDFHVVATNDSTVNFYARTSGTAAWTTIATHSTNIPTGIARAFSAGIFIIKSAGTVNRILQYQTQLVYQDQS